MGIGAGWLKHEYEQSGIPFDPAAARVDRMIEAVAVMKALWADGACAFAGEHYRVTGLEGWPKPVQRPSPPLFIGAGGKRLLSYAAREAGIVGIIAQATPAGRLDTAGDTDTLLAEKVAWVREAAGTRFEELVLSALIWGVAVNTDPGEAASWIAASRGMPVERVLASPYYLYGSVDDIVERVHALRERFGISYLTIGSHDMEAFAPVVARLAET
jgi:probable F420-dependent oxidoreductase